MKIRCDDCGATIEVAGGSELAAELLAKHKAAEHTSAESVLTDENSALRAESERMRAALTEIAAGDMSKKDMRKAAQAALGETVSEDDSEGDE